MQEAAPREAKRGKSDVQACDVSDLLGCICSRRGLQRSVPIPIAGMSASKTSGMTVGRPCNANAQDAGEVREMRPKSPLGTKPLGCLGERDKKDRKTTDANLESHRRRTKEGRPK